MMQGIRWLESFNPDFTGWWSQALYLYGATDMDGEPFSSFQANCCKYSKKCVQFKKKNILLARKRIRWKQLEQTIVSFRFITKFTCKRFIHDWLWSEFVAMWKIRWSFPFVAGMGSWNKQNANKIKCYVTPRNSFQFEWNRLTHKV